MIVLRENARSGRAEIRQRRPAVTEENIRSDGRADHHDDQHDEVEGHMRKAQDEASDESGGDDEVEAHRHVRTALPKSD